MNVLITGGAGFIGLNAARLLLRAPDCKIRILDDFSNSTPERVARMAMESQTGTDRIEVVRADVADVSSLNGVADGVDVIMHLAAQTGVAPSLADPRGDFANNVIGTFNMLELCRASGVRRFIFASSAAVLGNAPPPQREELPIRPLSPYAASKAAAEAYCRVYRHSFGIETIVLRFSNVYGPLSWSKGSVVARFLKRVLAGKALVVNGDGTQTRDFLHAEDLAEILVRAAQPSLDPALFGEACNVATGIQTRIADLAHAFEAQFSARGRPCRIEYGPALLGDVAVSAPATDRLRRLFPGVIFRGLDQGLPGTIDWFLTHWSPGADTDKSKSLAD
jgi:UDP-glucose 4-epimerase